MPQSTFSRKHIESLCVELKINGVSLVLCLIYRRPGSSFDDFLEDYAVILQNIGTKKSFIFGDFNLNLLKYDNCSQVQSFANLSFEFSFTSFINKPTRVTSHSATVLDHIYGPILALIQYYLVIHLIIFHPLSVAMLLVLVHHIVKGSLTRSEIGKNYIFLPLLIFYSLSFT